MSHVRLELTTPELKVQCSNPSELMALLSVILSYLLLVNANYVHFCK